MVGWLTFYAEHPKLLVVKLKTTKHCIQTARGLMQQKVPLGILVQVLKNSQNRFLRASCSWILSSGNLEVTRLSYFMNSVIIHLTTSRGRFKYLGGCRLRACSLKACPSTRERTESFLLSSLQNSFMHARRIPSSKTNLSFNPSSPLPSLQSKPSAIFNPRPCIWVVVAP